MNDGVLISVHGYEGDQHQIRTLLPALEHHCRPILCVSPEDSPVQSMSIHSCIHAGKRAYVGQDSWDRQYLQMKRLFDFQFDWYLLHDSDSVCLSPKLPNYLFAKENEMTVWSNEVQDFRIPGAYCEDIKQNIPADYHKGYPLIAMQPPYFLSRPAMEQFVKHGQQTADPITPFIDWYMVYVSHQAALKHQSFPDGVSFSTSTKENAALMRGCVEQGSIFLHSIKTQEVLDDLMLTYKQLNR